MTGSQGSAASATDHRSALRRNFALTQAQLVSMYERMVLIRYMEERLSVDRAAGKLPGGVHLYIGQEAVAVGVCTYLEERDWITSTHRGHGHFLAKGGDPNAMMAEIWGKRTGICRGMGGSMHVADVSKGILGANGIVGAGLAIATGAAFGAKLEAKGRVAVAFFGEGAANQGVFMETLNVSNVWGLPLIFLCENNLYGEFTPSRTVTAGKIVDRARAFGMPCAVVDGNVVEDVWEATAEAVEHARAGGGPSFIEAMTYRHHGHMEAEKELLGGGKYREQEEIDEWRKRDPIFLLRQRLLSTEAVDVSIVEDIERRTAARVEAAAVFAEASEPADPELSLKLMSLEQRA
jgi:TPP-dependent pyruvate/acetoin dehydrogenase alpha subunit